MVSLQLAGAGGPLVAGHPALAAGGRRMPVLPGLACGPVLPWGCSRGDSVVGACLLAHSCCCRQLLPLLLCLSRARMGCSGSAALTWLARRMRPDFSVPPGLL